MIPIEVIDEPSTPISMSGSEFTAISGLETVRIRNFERLDDEAADRVARLLAGNPPREALTISDSLPADEDPLRRRLLESLDDLRVDRQLGEPAPYQQLVLLWVVSRAVRRLERLQAFSQAREELRQVLTPFAVGRTVPDPALPWYALRTSPWWRLIGAPEDAPNRGRDAVRQGDLAAGLTQEAYDLVRDDAVFRDRAIKRLTAPLVGHRALHSTLTSLFPPEQPPVVERLQTAVEILTGLIGQELTTTTGAVNEVLAVDAPDVLVATSRSPEGQRVPIADVQRGLDLLYLHGSVTIDVDTLGHRSSFVGAVLAAQPGSTVSGSPPIVHFRDHSSPLDEAPRDTSSVEDELGDASAEYVARRIYDRGELHEAARAAGLPPGNRTAGITVVGENLCVFWNPFKRLYANRWLDKPREFTYSGEGSMGHQKETGGNLLLIEHESAGSPVQVFVKTRPNGSAWEHLGPYRVVDHWLGLSQDAEDKWRRDFRFRLAAVLDAAPEVERRLPEVPPAPPPPPATEAELWDALARGHETGRRRRETRTHRDKRTSDPLKTQYVVQRAIEFGGACELCDLQPGWLDDDGLPHSQAHHVDADVDLVDWIAALCGTCHDRMHHAAERAELADTLLAKIQQRQMQRGRPTISRREARQMSTTVSR